MTKRGVNLTKKEMINRISMKVFFMAASFLMGINICFSQDREQQEKNNFESEAIVWMGNERGMKNHRILGLTLSNSGAILAFTEARLDGTDEGPHDLVCKRSLDNGITWSSNIFIEKCDGRFWAAQGVHGKLESWSNPAALTDWENGRIFIFYVLNEGEYKGHNAQRMTRVFYRVSDDEGLTWSERTEVTDVLNVAPDGRPHIDINGQQIRNADGFVCDYLGRAFHMPGPGHGIQLDNGRLLMQFWHRRPIRKVQEDRSSISTPVSDRLYSSSVIYSDDHGESWTKGRDTGLGHHTTEARVVQLANGTVMMNARIHNRATRWVALSKDHGVSWEEEHEEEIVMPYTSVDCGLIRLNASGQKHNEKDWLVHSHPGKVDKREDLTLSLSFDGGITWPISDVVYAYGAQYSDLVQLKDGAIGLLYEKKNNHPGSGLTAGISFVRIELEQLMKEVK